VAAGTGQVSGVVFAISLLAGMKLHQRYQRSTEAPIPSCATGD
jgi:hypothetical protein